MTDASTGPTRALVLGGGGVTGVAWEIGIIAGLAAAGTDLTSADLVVGTSAGSVVGALVAAGTPVQEMYASQLEPPTAEIAAKLGVGVLAQYLVTMVRARDPQTYGARLGAKALRARTVSEAERRAVLTARLPFKEWPQRPLKVTAVDATSGEFTVFTRDSGVDLVDAVGASCAVPLVWPPVTIGERRYIDGGVRSATNANLASGYQRVVIIAPITTGGGPLTPLADQVAALRAEGAQVIVVSPDAATKEAIGRNVLDPARRAPAATAGQTQAGTIAAAIAELWG